MPSLLVPLERSRLKTLSRSVTPGSTKLQIINE
nr:MAG TPA: abscisic acid receptor [Caudoviricetes sp.]